MTHPLREFVAHGVRIEPAVAHRVSIPVGGPLWDGIDAPDFALHLRGGKPTGLAFQTSERQAQIVHGPTVWCGYAAANFGNFLAEYAPRLLAGATVIPNARFLFLLPPGVPHAGLRSWFWQVLAWFGIKGEQVVFCGSDPLVVDELHVFPQGEYMGTGGEPSPEYLDLLDGNTESRGLRVGGDEPVYVSRAGMGHRALGGELYLEEVLARVGVRTVRPESLSIAEQLATYAAAGTLVFAEGSAVHGRQLLGRRAGTEAVLMRRKGQRFCRRALEPRCDRLRYLDAIDASIHFSFDPITGKPAPYSAFPLTNGERLVEEFRSIGVDLSPIWSERRFRRQLEADLDNWARSICSRERSETRAERVRLMEGSLYGTGMQKYAPRLAEIARDM